MNCLNNMRRIPIPNDVVMEYIKLYKSIGINRYNHEILNSDYAVMVRQTISLDTYFFSKIFDISVSDARLKSLIYKDVLPKNKEERFVLNLKQAFIKMHKDVEQFELVPNEVYDLLKFVYNDVINDTRLQFRKIEKKAKNVSLLSSKYQSTREQLEVLIDIYNDIRNSNTFESSFLIENFYIDFINMKLFKEKNEEIGLLMLYLLLLTQEYEAFEYVSFFEILYQNKNGFETEARNASFNWEEGYAQVLPFHRFMLQVASEVYFKMSELIRDYEFDSHLNKSNNVENTINKLEDVFSKDDIRHVHPYISDSTINRTLKRLRDEEKIRPLGKGRSAKWMKLYESKSKKIFYEQLDLKL